MAKKPKYVYDVADVILPEELINRLQDNTRKEDDARWDDGDIAAELVDEFGHRFGKANVRKRIAIHAGVQAATIRSREEMARFFSEEIRDEFEILTWSQLRACKPAGAIKWRKLAQWAIESADEFGGQPAPVDAINMKRAGTVKKEEMWMVLFMRIWKACDLITVEANAPEDVVKAARKFQDSTEHHEEKLTEPAK